MEEVFDKELKEVLGERFIHEQAPVAKYEKVEAGSTEETYNIWGLVKFPLLFMALVAFLAWTAGVGLVDAGVAVPGMCLCSACFGWNVKRGND
jgi:hypothetical protein